MTRPAAFFVAAAMAVTAASVGVIAAYGLELAVGPSVIAGLGALAGMAVTHMAFVRAPEPDHARLDDLDRVVTDLQSRLEMAEVRLSTFDGQLAERTRAATKPLVEELASLGGLLTSVAKDVAAHDAKLSQGAAARALEQAQGEIAAAHRPAPPPAAPSYAPAASPPRRAAPAPNVIPAPEPFDLDVAEPEAPAAARGTPALIERALREGRIDIHLQPTVSLPSRRTAHYEALARIVERDGVTQAERFIETAARDGRVAAIDRRVFAKASEVALRLAAAGRGEAVFVNLAPETLADDGAVKEMRTAAARHPELARSLVLELSQAAFARLGPAERATLSDLAELGFRLSMDRVENLRLDGRELAQQGVRFLKLPAERLLDPASAQGLPIHPADLAGLLGRHGVELVATHVEDERTVPELLDMEVAAAQGALFGVPRPVRPPRDGATAAETAASVRLVPRSVAVR